MLIGSKAFSSLWKEWQKEYQPLQVLKLLLAYIEMPEDLSGKIEETQRLLSYFDPDLAPHGVIYIITGFVISFLKANDSIQSVFFQFIQSASCVSHLFCNAYQ